MPRLPVFTLAFCLTIALGLSDASGYNQWNNEYRKWPWRAETTETVTTPPGAHPHTTQLNTHAIDIGASGLATSSEATSVGHGAAVPL